MALQNCEKPEFTAKIKIPKQGTLSDAALGKRSNIWIAYDSWVLRNVSIGNMPYSIRMTNKEDGSAIDQLGILTIPSSGW